MSKEKAVYVNELTIRFEQLEGKNAVNWSIIPDAVVEKVQDRSLIDLAEMGAPLSAIGIRELWELCANGLIYAALETANSTMNGVDQRIEQSNGDHAPELEVGAAVIH
jgi:hypothetical protein